MGHRYKGREVEGEGGKLRRNKLQGPLKLPTAATTTTPPPPPLFNTILSSSSLSPCPVSPKTNMHVQEMQAVPSTDLMVIASCFEARLFSAVPSFFCSQDLDASSREAVVSWLLLLPSVGEVDRDA